MLKDTHFHNYNLKKHKNNFSLNSSLALNAHFSTMEIYML